MNHDTTIQILIRDGNPHGIKIAKIERKFSKEILIPRKLLQEASKLEDLTNSGVYFLIDNPEEESKARLYIGETEDLLERLGKHVQLKKF